MVIIPLSFVIENNYNQKGKKGRTILSQAVTDIKVGRHVSFSV